MGAGGWRSRHAHARAHTAPPHILTFLTPNPFHVQYEEFMRMLLPKDLKFKISSF
jgi:hypothetical protein